MPAQPRQTVPCSDRADATSLPVADDGALRLLDLVDRVLWIYDFDRNRMHWANSAGLQFWHAADASALRGRDFSPAALGTIDRLANLRAAIECGETRREQWTFYPKNQPASRDCRLSGVQLPDHRVAVLVDAGNPDHEKVDNSPELRAIEAIRQTPLMISLVTESGQWLMHNPAAERLANALGMVNLPGLDNFLAMFANHAEASQLRRSALEAGSADATLRLAGPTFLVHDVSLRRLTDPATGRISLIMTQQDVTRAYRMERRLHKSLARERAIAEMQRQFLSVTSHDFRTPLAVIDGAARRIGKLAEPGSPIAERSETIRETTRAMVAAVDRTLGWASIAEGRVDFRPERMALRPLVERALLNQRALNPARPFVVELADAATLMLDAGLVERVLDNLLSNAIKYSQPDQPIEIRCFERGGEILLTVADHGIGIPSQDLSRLFTRFFRSANAKGIKGSGVGLHAARFYMELHGGRISVKSREGQGTTFTIAFPVPA